MCCRLLLNMLLLLAFCGGVLSARDTEKKTYDDPAQVDEDYAFQGEYLGELTTTAGKQTLGLQVIARGNGNFDAITYVGGLPGAGWKRGDKTEKGKGTFADGAVVIEIKPGTMTIDQAGGVTIKADKATIGTLKKTSRSSPTLGLKPPAGAVVLFDGSGVGGFPKAKLTTDGLLMQGVTSERKFQSGTLHVEFRTPYQPHAVSQGRGNSGVYLQGRYEVQVLDSFGLDGKNNECGGIYSIREPLVNMCLPPLVWQTYDIDFTTAKYDGDKKTADAMVTVKHNGVVIHQDQPLPRTTTAAPVKESPEPGPLYLQDHGNPVRFRNVWFVEK